MRIDDYMIRDENTYFRLRAVWTLNEACEISLVDFEIITYS